MKDYNLNIILLLMVSIQWLSLSCNAQSKDLKLSYEHPIEINPESYICYKTSEEIAIDGLGDDDVWENVSWTKSFVDIEGDLKPKPYLDTKVKMVYDDNFFYFYAELKEPHIWANLKNRDEVIYYDDDFEIFIDPDGDSHNYYEFEWNAYNTLWDLILLRPYRVDKLPKVLYEYNVESIKSAVHIDGTLNDNSDLDNFWAIEIAIPWFALSKNGFTNSAPTDGEQWRVNFSRVDWTVKAKGESYEKTLRDNGDKIPEDNWVWSPTGRINMHMPEMWGFVQFSEADPNSNIIFDKKLDEEIKWGLWNLYWQQLKYYKINKKYTDDLSYFTVPKLKQGLMDPQIYITPNYFEITNSSISKNGRWIIDRDGKIYLKESIK